MRLVAYVRVSRVAGREGESFISPTIQRERIEAWTQANRYEVVSWLEDLDQPGSKLERPGLEEAMRQVESGAAEGIIVATLDRFTRSIAHLGKLLERLGESNARLVAVDQGIDTSTPTGELVANILGSIAKWELDRIRGNWATARSAAAARGVYLAEPPVGTRKTPKGILEPIPEAAPWIAGAFKRRVSGDSWATICRWLNDESDLRSKRGGAWTVSALRRAVGNRAYLELGIVSPAIFEAANAVKGVAPGRSGRASGLLSGILRCAGCRYCMKLSQSRTRHGKPFTAYRCKSSRGETAGGRCPAPVSVSAHLIDGFVMERFWDFAEGVSAEGVQPSALLSEAEAELLQAEAELDAALDRSLADALGGDDAPAYLTVIRQRKGKVEQARARLAEAAQRAESAKLGDVDLRTLWPNLSLDEQRKLLALALDCVFVRRTPAGGAADVASRTFVCFHGDAPELPRRGVRWAVRPFDFPAPAEAGGQ